MTGHHIDAQGRFQSDKYPDLPPDKIVLSFMDPRAYDALLLLATNYDGVDQELADDVRARLLSIGGAGTEHWSDCAVHNGPAYPPGPCDCGWYRR